MSDREESDTGLSHQVWKYPCNHKVKAPDTFTPAEFCPKCKDARGPEKADGPQVNMTDVASGIAQESVDLKNDLRGLVEQYREHADFAEHGAGNDTAAAIARQNADELEELIEDG